MTQAFRSGFVTIFGRPNCGKTTLLNCLCLSKLGIVSNKPQTTRHRLLGVRTGKSVQVIFLDTPGLVTKPGKTIFDTSVQKAALTALKDAQLVLLLLDLSRTIGEEDQLVIDTTLKSKKPYIVVLNKIDLVSPEQCQHKIAQLSKILEPQSILCISATKGTGILSLWRRLIKGLPPGPQYYPAETLTDQSSRFLVAEIIREVIFHQMQEEVPYGCAVLVTSYQERGGQLHLEANLLVERESLKGMLVGKNGQQIKAIGIAAREEISRALGLKTHLKLQVKVALNWRKDENTLKKLGIL